MRLENQVTIITGGASGMGLATVMRFLAEGARVMIADYNQATGEAALHGAIEAGYAGRVGFVRTDVAQEASV
jgi:NAD(P)-dependent dehydrogenase (short-subunit alcohol dehydrogenase family)